MISLFRRPAYQILLDQMERKVLEANQLASLEASGTATIWQIEDLRKLYIQIQLISQLLREIPIPWWRYKMISRRLDDIDELASSANVLS